MTAFIIIIVIIILGVILFSKGQKHYNASAPILSRKYSDLFKIILESHYQNEVIQNNNNRLIIGVRTYGGQTLFHINENVDNTISIKYEIKENPAFADFTLRFEFSQHKCLNEPEEIWHLINQEIESYIISVISAKNKLNKSHEKSQVPIMPRAFIDRNRRDEIKRNLEQSLKYLLEEEYIVENEEDLEQPVLLLGIIYDFAETTKALYPSMVATSKKENVPAPYSQKEFEALIDNLTSKVLADFFRT